MSHASKADRPLKLKFHGTDTDTDTDTDTVNWEECLQMTCFVSNGPLNLNSVNRLNN